MNNERPTQIIATSCVLLFVRSTLPHKRDALYSTLKYTCRCCGITDIRWCTWLFGALFHFAVLTKVIPPLLVPRDLFFRPTHVIILNWIKICLIERPLYKSFVCQRRLMFWNKYPITLTFPNSTRSCLSLILSQKAYNKLCTVGFRSALATYMR